MDPKGVISDARLDNGFDRYHLDMPSQTSSTYHRRSIPACDPSQSWSVGSKQVAPTRPRICRR